jgi:peptidoglycan/xylan/chitin deacetylase (PgdA/CDA1 family)
VLAPTGRLSGLASFGAVVSGFASRVHFPRLSPRVASIALAALGMVVLMRSPQGPMSASTGPSGSVSSPTPAPIAALPIAAVAPTPTPPLIPNLPLPEASRGSAVVAPRPGEEFSRGDPNGTEIYITIDDCQNWARVEAALEVARAKGVQLTLFPAGKYINEHPTDAARVLRKAVAYGNEIDNHGYSHAHLGSGYSVEAMKADLEAQLAIVRTALGDPDYQEWFVRTPYGSAMGTAQLKAAATDERLAIVTWSVDSKGYYKGSTVASVMHNVFETGRLSGGAIILMHDDYADMKALPRVIDGIWERGFTVGGVLKKILIDPAASAVGGGGGKAAVAAHGEIAIARVDDAPAV